MKIKNILVPIDFSNSSINALEWGSDIAKKTGAKLHVFHSYEYTATYAQVNYLAFMESIADTVEKSLLKDMKALERQISVLTELKPKYSISFDYTVKGIKDFASAENIDLIVMGTRGNNDVTNKLMGSTTHSIIENTSTPVLAIPEGHFPHEINKMVFAEDFKRVSPKNAMDLINELAKIYNGSLKILHISATNKEGSAVQTDEVLAIAKELKDIPHSYAFSVNKEPDKGILEYLDQNESDLLIMVPRKHGFFFNLFKDSITEQVVHRIKIPLLAIQDYEEKH
ncbi:MAG: universal stress protein [Candidatus Cyclobacteriaceae bacterium M2_1C_046]